MKIETSDPPEDGRYVAFVRCASWQVNEWAEPIIATWHGGRWHHCKPVYGWIGPLPVVKRAECFPVPREYDL